MRDAAWPPNYPDSHDPTGPPSTEELLGESSAARRYRAAVDGPLGVTFHDFGTRGNGGVIVTERVVEKVAEVMGLDPAECELVTITDNETGALLWPKD